MLALVLGLVVMGHRLDNLSGLTWHAIGLASGLGLYFLESYFAFFEGCLFALYIASLWPHLARRVTHYPPGQVLSLSLLSWSLLCVASVWVVAYNFVPGGSLTRERTDVLIALAVLLVSLASRDYHCEDVKGVSGGGDVGEGGGVKSVVTGGEREGMELRRRVMSRLPPITEEKEDEEEEAEKEERDFEVDSTGSSVHEERALELLATEEKECVRFRRRANRGRYIHTHTHTHTPYLPVWQNA